MAASELTQPSLAGVKCAREIIAPHLQRTPVIQHPVLCNEVGLDLWVKHENHLPTGAFKIRGGFNLLAELGDEERKKGLVSATRGNHGQSIALACRTHGVRCAIVVPFGNNPEKNEAMRAYGAELVEHGEDFEHACERAAELAAERGMHLVQGTNALPLIHGVGTAYLEVLEDLPDVDTVIIPLGGGSGVCGAIAVFRELKPDVKIIAVQAENAPSYYESWKQGRVVGAQAVKPTIADGLATRCPASLPFETIREGIDTMLLVTEEEIAEAIRLCLRATHNLAEGAAAAALAAAVKLKNELRGKRVVVTLTGGNIDRETLRRIL